MKQRRSSTDFSKTCLDRVGLFKEMGYLHGKGWTPPFRGVMSKAAEKGRQIMADGVAKTKCGLSDGYFNKFCRIYQGEGYIGRVQRNNLTLRKLDIKKNVTNKPWLPSSGYKHTCGSGTYHGTISGPIEAFSGATRQRAVHKSEGRNIQTSPGQKGTGYGYPHVTINRYPEHREELQGISTSRRLGEEKRHQKLLLNGDFKTGAYHKKYFDDSILQEKATGPIYRNPKTREKVLIPFLPPAPAKMDGGCKEGCINRFPEHMPDAYTTKQQNRRRHVVNSSGKTYNYPSISPKSTRQPSILTRNVDKYINPTNYTTISAVICT